MTIEQDWARERNFTKMRLMGMLKHCRGILHLKSLTGSEKDYIEKVEACLKNGLSDWDERNKYSKRKYLREVAK